MNKPVSFHSCIICESKAVNLVLKTKDYTVSDRLFEIWECNACKLRFTQDIPDESNSASYYKSTNYVSHSNTKKGIVNRLYHLVRKRTLIQKAALVKKESRISEGAILDIGAGTGAFVATMQSEGWQVTGLEPDADARNNAKKDFNIQLNSLDNLFSFKAESFDVITLWHVLEHVHLLHDYLDVFYKTLKPNGTLIVAVPNYTSYDAKHYGEFWAAYDVPRHLYHFSPKSMDILMRKHQFKVVNRLPMKYDSFYVSMLSEQYKNGKGNLLKAFLTGLKSNSKAGNKAEEYSSIIYIIKKEK